MKRGPLVRYEARRLVGEITGADVLDHYPVHDLSPVEACERCVVSALDLARRTGQPVVVQRVQVVRLLVVRPDGTKEACVG